jgi:N-acetylmuramoyl-L-alanine amidase
MAIFLLKARHGAGFTPPAATGMFGDVPPGYWAAAWIEELVRQGITAGCGAGNYCPEGAVTRAQMAIFLLKALDPGLSPPPPTGIFSDVPPGYWAAAWIEELVRRAIAAGCGNGQFCPDAAVSRAEMAVLLVNTFDIPM